MKQSYVDVLYTAGLATGVLRPAGRRSRRRHRVVEGASSTQGEPYDDDPLLQHAVEELTSHHSGYYIDDSIPPAPLFIYDAFTDDIMPPVQALRFYNKTKSLYPAAEVALQFLDGFAHPRGLLASPMRTDDLQPRDAAPRPPSHGRRGRRCRRVEVYTQACNGSAQAGPVHRGRLGEPPSRRGAPRRRGARRRFDSAGGDPATAAVGRSGRRDWSRSACRTVPTSTDDPGAATYRVPAAACTYTLMGSPTVIADLDVDGDFARDRGAAVGRRAGRHAVARHARALPSRASTTSARRSSSSSRTAGSSPPGTWRSSSCSARARPTAAPRTAPSPSRRATSSCACQCSRRPARAASQAPAPPVLPAVGTGGHDDHHGDRDDHDDHDDAAPPSAQTVLGKRFVVRSPGRSDQRRVVGRRRSATPTTSSSATRSPTAPRSRSSPTAATDSSARSSACRRRAGARPARSASATPTARRAARSAASSSAARRTTSSTSRCAPTPRYGAVDVVPPNPGSDGGFVLTFNGIYRYCVGFGGAAGGAESVDGDTTWVGEEPDRTGMPGAGRHHSRRRGGCGGASAGVGEAPWPQPDGGRRRAARRASGRRPGGRRRGRRKRRAPARRRRRRRRERRRRERRRSGRAPGPARRRSGRGHEASPRARCP